MTSSTKLDENFRAWKYRVTLILQENDLDNFVKEVVAEPKEDKAKTRFRKT